MSASDSNRTAADGCGAEPCVWCQSPLEGVIDQLKAGSSGENVRELQRHLVSFGMQSELSQLEKGDWQQLPEVKGGTWAAGTTRALRMFARHPAVGSEKESVLNSDGQSIDRGLLDKIRTWCHGKVRSPQNYWEYKQLNVQAGDCDVLGSRKDPTKQSVPHDFIAQIQRDLSKTGFAPHDDALCGLRCQPELTGTFSVVGANTAGRHVDSNLTDLSYLIRKFQRQAGWLWRMDATGQSLPDAGASDPTTYSGAQTGKIDAATARALHAWAEAGLHMVIGKFPMKGLTWPPGGPPIFNSPGSAQAKLRADAFEAWQKAATQIHALGATLQGPYASCPRGWAGGKPKESSASAYSWHYAGLAVDICQSLLLGDGSTTDAAPYGIEVDGTKFRIWCRVVPQPAKPDNPSDDRANPVRQYRNRNIKYKYQKGGSDEKVRAAEPADAKPLYFATRTACASGTSVIEVAAREGWYVDVTAILEANRLMRINRHADWVTHAKSWEWWHHQYNPDPPPGTTVGLNFGECLQLQGIHELRLRQLTNGWPCHEDMEHRPG